jgi:TonB family protein
MSLPVFAAAGEVLHLLGWSLLHFLWEGALVALLLTVVLAMARQASAQTRYLVCCVALVLMAFCPLATFAYLEQAADGTAHVGLIAASVGRVVSAQEPSAPTSLLERVTAVGDQAVPWMLAVWMIGVLVFVARAIAAGMTVRRLRIASIVAAPESLMAMASYVAERIGIMQAFQIFVSEMVTAPTVVGWLKPVILFPVASLMSLTPEQLEAMLAHELAHIRRRDYLVNALQVAVETLLFYHPAVWWVSRQIRREREHCCDDVAVAVTGSPLVYARALYLLEEQRAMAPQLMLGGNGGQLAMRIRRLLTRKQSVAGTGGAAGWVLTVAFLVLTAAVAASIATLGRAQATALSAEGKGIPWSEAEKHLQHLTPAKYPELAKAAHVKGDVVIAFTIDSKGDVKAAHVVSGPPMLTQAALDSVIHSKFSSSEDQLLTTAVTIFFRPGNLVTGDNGVGPALWCTYYGDHKGMICDLAKTETSQTEQSQLDPREEFKRTWEARKTNQ